MIAIVRNKGSERLWRLFGVACVRTITDLMRDARSRDALDVAERFADGLATRSELEAARAHAEAAAHQAFRDEYLDEVRVNFGWDAEYGALCKARWAADAVLPCVADDLNSDSVDEGLRLSDMIREVFGNPFQWKIVEQDWLTWNGGAAVILAREMYDSRDFTEAPLLADMLEDAGCTDPQILEHLRGPGPHVRGCWVVDLLLGKS